MSIFSTLNDTADKDVVIILGQTKKNDETLIVNDADVKQVTEHLDDVEARFAATVDIMGETAVATESADLSAKDLTILRTSMKAIAGYDSMKTVAAESDDSVSRSSIALEGFKETLTRFWQYLKAQMVKFWNILKRWWIKTFDISKRLLGRAKKMRDKADKEYGSPQFNEIPFHEIKKLAVNGKFHEPNNIISGLSDIEELVDTLITRDRSDAFDDNVEDIANNTFSILTDLQDRIFAAQKNVPEGTRLGKMKLTVSDKLIADLRESISHGYTTNNSDLINLEDFDFSNSVKYKKMYAGEGDVLQHSKPLPGDSWILSVTPPTPGENGRYITDLIDDIRRSKLVIAPSSYGSKSYDPSMNVRTLLPSQISRGCDFIIRICENVFQHKVTFEARDRMKERIFKDIDNIVRQLSGEDATTFGELDRIVRGFSNAITGFIRRRSEFETNLCAYATGTSAAFLNYSELSLKQYS